MKIFSQILSFLFPSECLGCKTEGFQICLTCLQKISAKIQQKSFHLKYFEKILVFTDYENPLVERAIKKLKFRFARRILQDVEPFLRQYFPKKQIPNNSVFVPVPLHFLRQNKRGFNQSELIAKVFSQIFCGEDRVCNLLKRIRNTPHQSHLSKEERMKNVKNAFVVNVATLHCNVATDTPIVLVDDVATTGSTLLECAKALKQYGFKKVWGMVIARGK